MRQIKYSPDAADKLRALKRTMVGNWTIGKNRFLRWRIMMELKDSLIQLRKKTGLNRKEFAEYFGIPYRTVQDWELGNRQMPEYLLRLMEYKIRIEEVIKKQQIKEKEI